MEARLPYDDFPVVFLPPYESPPAWVPPHEVRGTRGDTGMEAAGGCCRLTALLSSPLSFSPLLLPLTAALPPRLQQRAHAVPAPHRRPQEAARGAGRTPPGTPSSSSNPSLELRGRGVRGARS